MVVRLRSSFSDRRLAIIASLVLLTLLALAMLAARMAYTGTRHYVGLGWNLVLAWVPFVLSLVIYARAQAGASLRVLVPLAALWLVFFPNAPYIVTDLKHLDHRGEVPILYDVLLVATAAWAGLLLGLSSLFLIHGVVRRLVGALSAWALVVGVLAISSFGIYLGRVQRWNSWDVLLHPQALAHEIAAGLLHPQSNPRPLALTVLLTSFLLASYVVLYSFARLSSEWDALERTPR
jgi:uncharacterized membrane protein